MPDLATGHIPHRFTAKEPEDRFGGAFDLSPDGSRFAVLPSGRNGTVRDLATGKVVCRIPLAEECVLHLGYSPDGRTLVVGSRDEPLRLLDASTGKVLHTLGEKPAIGKSFSGAAFSPDGKIVTEIGCRQSQRYVESPGRFDPCVPYAPGEKAWAPHA